MCLCVGGVNYCVTWWLLQRFWLTAVPVCLYVCVGVCDIKCGVPRPFPPWTLGNRSFSGARINVRVWITFPDSGMTPDSKTGGWKRSLWSVHRHKMHKNNSISISLWWMWPLVCAVSKSCDECVCFINLVQCSPKVPSFVASGRDLFVFVFLISVWPKVCERLVKVWSLLWLLTFTFLMYESVKC